MSLGQVPATARPRRIALEGRPGLHGVLGALGEDRHPAVLSGAWLGLPGPVRSGAGLGFSETRSDVQRELPGPAQPAPADSGLRMILTSEPLILAPPDADPFRLLDDVPAVGENPDGALAGGGWIGWLGYGLGDRAEPGVLGPPPPQSHDMPAYWLAFYDHLIICEHGDEWSFEMLETPERADALAAELERWRRRISHGAASGRGHPSRRLRAPELRPVGAGAAGHVAAVEACRERIAAGDLYQANLCFGLMGEWDGDGLRLLASALDDTQPRLAAALGGVVSLSPERFLRRRGTTVWSEPMKGTRARPGHDGVADAAIRAELTTAAKDAAEHVMIVDLVRNDLGRVCEYGTVAAAPPRAEAHPGVWQLVSTVTGQLRPEVSNADLLTATFPPGSVSGAPKIAAMALISELESTRREVYTGAVGISSPLAGLDLNVAIRTFELTPGRIWLGVGGAIVADSDPAAELAEALLKATATLGAVGGRVIAAPPEAALGSGARRLAPAVRGRRGPWPRRALGVGPRPDPAAGVFTTLLTQDGRPQFVSAHLERLATSVAALYGRRLDDQLPARLSVAGAGLTRGRIRVVVGPDGAVQVGARPEAAPRRDAPALRLEPWLLPGGFGAHKWLDRRLISALGEAQPATVPLMIDADGSVLEAGYANVWIVEAQSWITPPADGRILPGITRALLLANPAVSAREECFDLVRLRAADAVFLTSAVSGRRRAMLATG